MVNKQYTPENMQVANLQPYDPEVTAMLLSDTFRNYTGHADDRFVSYLLSENTQWLPRVPQASAPNVLDTIAMTYKEMHQAKSHPSKDRNLGISVSTG